MKRLFLSFALLATISCPVVAGDAIPAKPWNSLEIVFAGKLDQVQRGPVGMSFPPLYTAQLTFTVTQSIRGNLKAGDKITLAHAARQEQPPAYPDGEVCLVGAATGDHDTLTLVRIEKTDAKKTESITRACQLPVGWTMVGDQAISPWARLGDKVWPKDAKSATTITCAKTGRPALLCSDAVTFTVKPLPPKQEIQWTNPDGDGDYAVTVSNKTAKAVQVPALLTDGKAILWANSLVIICQDQIYPLPGCRLGLTKLEPVTLPPNGSVTGTVNPLALTGPEWPQGGYRISFQFCLGEKSVGHSFYYMSRHHDRIRDALQPAH